MVLICDRVLVLYYSVNMHVIPRTMFTNHIPYQLLKSSPCVHLSTSAFMHFMAKELFSTPPPLKLDTKC